MPGQGAEKVHGASLHTFADAAATSAGAAAFIADAAQRACAARGRFRLALAGGNTPRGAYLKLSEPEMASTVAWDRVEVFFGDERCVPPDDPSSNYRMARESLLDRVPVPERNVHRMEGELSPRLAAERYAAVLGAEPLDLVLIGMGGDGHVASLFPGGPELEVRGQRVVATRSPLPPPDRVSVTLDVIDAASLVVVLVTGDSKATVLARVLSERAAGAPVLPAARIVRDGASLHWFVDNAAISAWAHRATPQ